MAFSTEVSSWIRAARAAVIASGSSGSQMLRPKGSQGLTQPNRLGRMQREAVFRAGQLAAIQIEQYGLCQGGTHFETQ